MTSTIGPFRDKEAPHRERLRIEHVLGDQLIILPWPLPARRRLGRIMQAGRTRLTIQEAWPTEAPSTVLSRFSRLGLPSPSELIEAVNHIHLAALIAIREPAEHIAYRIGFANRRALERHVEEVMGVSWEDLRANWSEPAAFSRFWYLVRTDHPGWQRLDMP
jgi:hypothetical protein